MTSGFDTLTLHRGRPSDTAGRPAREMRVYDLLDRLGVAYDRIDHEPVTTMAEGDAIRETLQAQVCKNLFLCTRRRTAFYLLMIPDDKRFRAEELTHQLGLPRLSFGKAEDMARLLELAPGFITVMGLMNDRAQEVQLLMDRAILDSTYIGCHPCVNTASIRMRTEELLHIVLPAMAHEPLFVRM